MTGEVTHTVTVETFPPWRGGPPQRIPVTSGTTLHDLLESLRIPADTEAIIVNGVYEHPDYRLEDGDRVVVIPFMSGG